MNNGGMYTSARAFVIGSALSLAVTGCSSDDTSQPSEETSATTSSSIADPAPATTVTTGNGTGAVSEAPSAPNPDVDVALDWTLEATYDGSLQQPTAWSGGGAAVLVDGESDTLGGELWLSQDGVEWGPADDPPPGEVLEIEGHDGSLFIVTDQGDRSTLWKSGDDGRWQEVVSDEHGVEVAIGPERLIAFHFGPKFKIVGVYDTQTLEASVIGALPEVDKFVYQGRVVALDDGFLLDLSWLDEELDFSERRLLASTDGSSWVESDAIDDGVSVWGGVTYDGVTLIAPGAGEAVLWHTEDGATFSTALPGPGHVADTPVATSAGFFVVGDAQVHHSDDGKSWRGLETPTTWDLGRGQGTEVFGTEAFSSGQMLVIDDDLIAVTIRGEIGAFGYLGDPQTEIWQAPLSSISNSESR